MCSVKKFNALAPAEQFANKWETLFYKKCSMAQLYKRMDRTEIDKSYRFRESIPQVSFSRSVSRKPISPNCTSLVVKSFLRTAS